MSGKKPSAIFDVGQLQIGDAILAAIVESSDDAIVSKTLDGIIITWNNAAQRIFGYTPDEAIGQSIAMLLPPDRISEETAILAKLRSGERIDHLETVRVTKSGRRVHVSVTSSPIRDCTGKIVAASKIARDITERKVAETQKLQQQTEIEHMARLKTMGEIATGLAHELNQPLTSILTYARLLLERAQANPSSDGKTAVALAEVVNETHRAAEIIRRMQDFGRKRLPTARRLCPNAVMADALHLMEHDLKAAGIPVRTILSESLPMIEADPVQLVQVLVNLLRNARDAMLEAKASSGDLIVQSLVEGDLVTLQVIDRGCGVCREKMDRIFDRFFTTKSSGLGMGLAISKTIIESLGGTLTAQTNEPQNGMTFSIRLPLPDRLQS